MAASPLRAAGINFLGEAGDEEDKEEDEDEAAWPSSPVRCLFGDRSSMLLKILNNHSLASSYASHFLHFQR